MRNPSSFKLGELLGPIHIYPDIFESTTFPFRIQKFPCPHVAYSKRICQSICIRCYYTFTIACELDMINAISAADITFIMSSSTSAWLLSPLEWSPQKQMATRLASVSEDELCEKCIIKQLLNLVFAWYHELSKPRVCVICRSRRLRQITQTSTSTSTLSNNCLLSVFCAGSRPKKRTITYNKELWRVS